MGHQCVQVFHAMFQPGLFIAILLEKLVDGLSQANGEVQTFVTARLIRPQIDQIFGIAVFRHELHQKPGCPR